METVRSVREDFLRLRRLRINATNAQWDTSRVHQQRHLARFVPQGDFKKPQRDSVIRMVSATNVHLVIHNRTKRKTNVTNVLWATSWPLRPLLHALCAFPENIKNLRKEKGRHLVIVPHVPLGFHSRHLQRTNAMNVLSDTFSIRKARLHVSNVNQVDTKSPQKVWG